MSDMDDSFLDYIDNRSSLNTPPTLSMTQTTSEQTTENILSPDLPLSEHSTDFINEFSLLSEENLTASRLDTLTTSVNELIQRMANFEEMFHRDEQWKASVKTSLDRHEQSKNSMIGILQNLVQSINALTYRVVQPISVPDPSEDQWSESETAHGSNQTSDANADVSTYRIEDLMATDPENLTTSIVSQPRLPIVHENEGHSGHTTNDSNRNGRLPFNSAEIDKIRLEKHEERTKISQGCNEIYITTSTEPSISNLTNNHGTSPISTNISATPKKRRQHKPQPSTSHQIDHRSPPQMTTSSENSAHISHNESIEVCLLHPLKEKQLSLKTDRSTVLKDCFGKTPVLLVFGDSVPDKTSIEMAMVSRSDQGDFYSVYRLSEKQNKDTDVVQRQIKLDQKEMQRIELIDYQVTKQCTYQMKNRKTFTPKPYTPVLDKDKISEIVRPTDLVNTYKLNEPRLTIRCVKDNILVPNVPTFYSNVLSKLTNEQPEARLLDIIKVRPTGQAIFFDCNNRCPMEFYIKLPEMLYCTLRSGYKWFEIAILTQVNSSYDYLIAPVDGDTKNPYYFKITEESFSKPFEVVKQTLSELASNKNPSELPYGSQIRRPVCPFRIRFRLLHTETPPDHASQIENYLNYEPWISVEYNEDQCPLSSQIAANSTDRIFFDNESSHHNEQLPVTEQQNVAAGYSGQKRPNEECDFSRGLPVIKAPKLS